MFVCRRVLLKNFANLLLSMLSGLVCCTDVRSLFVRMEMKDTCTSNGSSTDSLCVCVCVFMSSTHSHLRSLI